MELTVYFKNLAQILDEEVLVYRHFLDIVRREHEILLKSDLEELIENNRSKEAMITKIKSLERIREKRSREIAHFLQIKADPIRLTDIASKLEMEQGDKLRAQQSALDLLMKRVQENNKKNETLVQSALTNIHGALENLKSSLQDKATYKNEGQIKEGNVQAGRFVSREA